MKKNQIVVMFFLLASICLTSPLAANDANREKGLVYRLGLGQVGLEVAMAKNVTMVLGTSVTYDITEEALAFTLSGAGRYYYNLEKRARRGEQTAKFAADYLTLLVESRSFIFPNDIDRVLFIGGGWGFQRNLGKIFYIGAEGTLGIGIRDIENKARVNINFFLGLAL